MALTNSESLAYPEPTQKRCAAFVDGQNLYHSAKRAFGYTYPNYDVEALTKSVCAKQGWLVSQVRFYTGIPANNREPVQHRFWAKKTRAMARVGIQAITRPLRYQEKELPLFKGSGSITYNAPVEKGIDVRIAVDLIRLANDNAFDVALIFSQDQDLAEATDEVRRIKKEQKRWFWLASAFPVSDTCSNKRGIDRTDWIEIDKDLYDSCIDPKDYR